jgi:serine/threonine protein kinase
MKQEPIYNKLVSKEVNDFIKSLLYKDPDRRIKPSQIPFHPWFKGVNFDDINNRRLRAPFIPLTVKILNEYRLVIQITQILILI